MVVLKAILEAETTQTPGLLLKSILGDAVTVGEVEPKPRPVLLFSTQQLQDAQNSIIQNKYGLIILFLFVHNFFLVRLFNTEHHLCHWFAIFGVNFCVLSEHFIIEGNAVRIWSWKLREKHTEKRASSHLSALFLQDMSLVFLMFSIVFFGE